MPSRPVALLIVLLWLSVGAWFVIRDFGPRLASDDSPPYTINVIDEFRQQQIDWRVSRRVGDQTLRYLARADLTYREKTDTFEYGCDLVRRNRKRYLPGLHFASFQFIYTCDRNGRLLSAELYLRHELAEKDKPDKDLEHWIYAKTDAEKVTLRWDQQWRDPKQGNWKPVPLSSYFRRVLIPFHPPNQMKGLKPGQTWREPMLNLHPDALIKDDFTSTQPIIWMQAKVHPSTEKTRIRWRSREHRCILLEHTGEKASVRLWIQENPPHKVLKYEVSFPNEIWTFNRPNQA